MNSMSFLLELSLLVVLSEAGIELDSCRTFDVHRLAPVLRHCHEEPVYRDLTMINLEKAQLDFHFYEVVNEQLNLTTRKFTSDNYTGSVPSGSCVLLYLPMKDMKEMLQPGGGWYPWNPENVYILVVSARSGRVECATGMFKEEEDEEEEDITREYIFQGLNGLWKDTGIDKVVVGTREGSFYYLDPFEPQDSEEKLTGNQEGTEANEKARFGVLKEIGATAEGLKSRKDFRGRSIEVAIFPYITVRKINDTFTGMDANVMEEVCRGMNATWSIYEPPDWFGWVDANGTVNGALGRLVHHRSDLSFNGFFVKDYYANTLIFTTYVLTDSICVMVPKRGMKPDYLLIVRIFSVESWSLIIVGNCLVAVVYVTMRDAAFGCKNRGGEGKPGSLRNVDAAVGKSLESDGFLASWVFFSVYPMETKTKSDALRFLVNFGLMLGIIITGSFTSKLASSFSKPVFEENIETLRELAESNYDILTIFPDLLDDVFFHDERATYRRLQAKLKVANVSEIVRRVVQMRDAGYLHQANQALLEDFGPYNLHMVSECPKNYIVAYPIHRGSPYLSRVNEIIERLHNGGIVQKWFDDMRIPRTSAEQSKPVVIRMSHLYIPFAILICGLGTGFGVFLVEISSQS